MIINYILMNNNRNNPCGIHFAFGSPPRLLRSMCELTNILNQWSYAFSKLIFRGHKKIIISQMKAKIKKMIQLGKYRKSIAVIIAICSAPSKHQWNVLCNSECIRCDRHSCAMEKNRNKNWSCLHQIECILCVCFVFEKSDCRFFAGIEMHKRCMAHTYVRHTKIRKENRVFIALFQNFQTQLSFCLRHWTILFEKKSSVF